MTYMLLAAAAVVGLVFATFTFFVFAMHVQDVVERRGKKLRPEVMAVALVIVFAGHVCNFLLNAIVATALTLDLPREKGLSLRCIRYLRLQDSLVRPEGRNVRAWLLWTWRRWHVAFGGYWCRHWLDPFDTHPDGCHCRPNT